MVEVLKGKNKRKSETKPKDKAEKKRKKVEKRRKRDSPPIDEQTIAQYKEKTSSKRKRKEAGELSEVDKLKQEALAILAPYTTAEFPFNPEYAGEPSPLLATRGDYEIHKENIFKDMKLRGKFFKFSTMTLVFDNVSLFSLFITYLCLGSFGCSKRLDIATSQTSSRVRENVKSNHLWTTYQKWC